MLQTEYKLLKTILCSQLYTHHAVINLWIWLFKQSMHNYNKDSMHVYIGIIISLVPHFSNTRTRDEFVTFQTSRIHVATNNRYIQRLMYLLMHRYSFMEFRHSCMFMSSFFFPSNNLSSCCDNNEIHLLKIF